jgi:hypothetical protein
MSISLAVNRFLALISPEMEMSYGEHGEAILQESSMDESVRLHPIAKQGQAVRRPSPSLKGWKRVLPTVRYQVVHFNAVPLFITFDSVFHFGLAAERAAIRSRHEN